MSDTNVDSYTMALESNTKLKPQTIYLYLLHNPGLHNPTQVIDIPRIKACLPYDFNCFFTGVESIDQNVTDEKKTYIYKAKLELLVDNRNSLYVRPESGPLSAGPNFVRLPSEDRIYAFIYGYYDDKKGQYMHSPFLIEHYFLFDVDDLMMTNFSHSHDEPVFKKKSYRLEFPVPFWNQLFIYTYYLTHHKMYDVFDILTIQFQAILQKYHPPLAVDKLTDFFHGCSIYLPYVTSTSSNQYITAKIIARMTGLLPIQKINFNFKNNDTINFTSSSLSYIKEHYDDIFREVSSQEWVLFRDGLVIYLSFEILNKSSNTIDFLHLIQNEEWKKDLATVLLRTVESFKKPILCLNWTSIFLLVQPKIIASHHLRKIDSIQIYIKTLIRILEVTSYRVAICGKISKQFDELIRDELLPVNLESIIYLLKFLQYESVDNKEQPKIIFKTINTVIESSVELQKKIKEYLYSIKITIEQFQDIRFIILQIPKFSIFNQVEENVLFITLLTDANPSDSYEFFKQWFYSSLIEFTEVNETNKKEYSYVLGRWSATFLLFNNIFLKILMAMDEFIEAFQNEEYQLTFVKHIIHLCFQKGIISPIIFDGRVNIQNKLFLKEFFQQFEEQFLNISQDELKQICNLANPLSLLIHIKRDTNSSSQLLTELIELTCKKIQFTIPEILEFILKKPTQTSWIYFILFEDCFEKSQLREFITKKLIKLWNIWEKKSFFAIQILKWRDLTTDERNIVDRICFYLGQKTGNVYDIDTLLNKQEHEMDTKPQIKGEIRKSLDIYCPNAFDKQDYLDYFVEMDTQSECEIDSSMKIQYSIKWLLAVINRLHLIENLYTWRRFLAKDHIYNLATTSITAGVTLPETLTDNLQSSDETEKFKPESNEFSRSYDNRTYQTTSDSNANMSIDRRSCINVLRDSIAILYEFINRLIIIILDWQRLPISDLLILFSDTQYIDHDFKILKPLLQPDDFAGLKSILEFWNNRQFLWCLCKGYIKLCKKYEIEIGDELTIFQNILDINEQTSGEICVKTYQDYRTHDSNKYSESILKFINEWSSSHEMFELLYSLDQTDIDNLLEVVNNWDETLINTQTVLDFVLLKRFLDKIDIKINQLTDPGRPRELDDLINSLQEILNETEFETIKTTSIESCYRNLTIIQNIHLKFTNKDESKRKRILDIMAKSQLCFDTPPLKETVNSNEYHFNACITNINWEPLLFNDLSDLRDRARLIQNARQNNKNNLHNYSDDQIQQIQSFVSLVDKIQVILENLTTLYTAGYPVMKRFPSSRIEFACINGKYGELERFQSDLETELTEWERQLCDNYKACINLTYLSDQQISMIDDAVREQTLTKSNDLTYHLFKFMGIDPTSIQSDLFPDTSEHHLDILKNITRVLRNKHEIRSFSSQEDEKNNKKIFLVEITDNGILRAIMSLFHLNKISTPLANRLFYCTRYSTWVEIRAFIYRCFYSQTLHQLIRPELLSITIQDQFSQLFNELIARSPKHFFRLGLIISIPSSDLYLINSLKQHEIIQTICDQDLLDGSSLGNSIRKLVGDRCMMVTSRIAGLGKSAFIENEIQRLGKVQIKFSISGDMNIDTLVKRLHNRKIQSASSTIALHINIGPAENVQQLNEFLYSLVIFRCFRFGQLPADVPSEIPIYIELDSSLHLTALTKNIVIFEYLKTRHIERLEWNELNSRSTSFQWVANYLQAIENGKINAKNIDENTLTSINQLTCRNLLQKYFLPNKDTDFISWTQLSIFVSVYYKLFSDFSKCGYFMVDPEVRGSLRSDLLQILLNSSDQFTSLSVKAVRQNQRVINGDDNNVPLSEAVTRWDQSKPFTMIFTATYDPLFVYKTEEAIPSSLRSAFLLYYKEIGTKQLTTTINKLPRGVFSWFRKPKLKTVTHFFPSAETIKKQLDGYLIDPNQMTHEQFFLRLTSLSTKYFIQKPICEICFTQYDDNQQHCIKCSAQDSLRKLGSLNDHDIESFQKTMAVKLQSQYVFTADNYVKMLLIYLRVQSNLPVLIMGETGVGKTSLIQCLCRKILDDDMEVLHIHAGVTNEEIIKAMHEYIERAEKLSQQKQNKRLWVFFDEFNTTPNIGLLKEIVCERTLLGEPLPENMVFLGACNPQRRKAKKKESVDQVGIKKYHLDMQRQIHGTQSPLLYSVEPIPETMLEHVWDYGSLNNVIEDEYTKKMLNACTNLTTDEHWFACTVNLISVSQKYFREHDDVSSVSLRDVARFCRFYNWFYKFPVPCEDQQASTAPSYTIIERASLLALFLCYYFRLNSSVEREDYMKTIADSIKEVKPGITCDLLDALLHNEKMALVKRMVLPPGTATNRALTDNIFVLFTCILNHIPVILSGKPGSSKTSAVQILISNLKGEDSKDELFQKISGLIAISYQGSLNCTSESIIKVFEQADKFMKAKNTMKLLPVIVFDEIGLAELSPYNPLKVLHSHLEIENCLYGFVGLSNWRLDASKMNRAIYLSCPEPNIEDLKITAVSLFEAILPKNIQNVSLDDSIINGLVVAYMEMCVHMKKQKKEYYFGLRDYYSLIRGIAYDTAREKDKQCDPYKIIRNRFSCDFDGIIDESKFIWSKFCEHTHQENKIEQYPPPTFGQLLHQCFSTRKGRFLMLIGNSDSDFDYIQQYVTIKHPSIETQTLIGSAFAGDFLPDRTFIEPYNVRVLTDIIYYTEKNITVFFRGLAHLYDNLYDLFNQNFTVLEKKKYCRIALGSLYHPRCIIHDNFYCVVFVKKEDLHKYDSPFLNRFEKHVIDMNSLITERQKHVKSELDQWINQLTLPKLNECFLSCKHLFLEFDDDYIRNLTSDAFHQLNISDNNDNDQNDQSTMDVIEYCKDQMIRTSSFDFPLFLSLNVQTAQLNDTNDLIQRYYDLHGDLSFSSFINQKFLKEKIPKLLIYTYTQLFDNINYDGIVDHQKWIEEVKLNHFKTELELIQKLKIHCQSDSTSLLCIRVDYHLNHQHISMLKHALVNQISSSTNHGVCLIFHLQRHKLNAVKNNVYFDGWTRVMIDDLQKHQIIPQNILMNRSYERLVDQLNFLNLDSNVDKLINRCMINLRYEIPKNYIESTIDERRCLIIQQLTSQAANSNTKNISLHLIVKNHLLEIMRKIASNPNQTQFADWRYDLLTDSTIIGSCCSLNDALRRTVLIFLERCLLLLLFYMENHSLIDSYTFFINCNNQIGDKLSRLRSHCWTTTFKTIDISILSRNDITVPLISDLHLPCAMTEYDIIRQIRQTVGQICEENDGDLIEFAYNELINKSIYGEFIKEILDDSDLFHDYYHDQLTLARDEANIYQLSTSFIQRLLTANTSQTIKDRLRYLLIDYQEFFDILRIFETSILLIGDEDAISKIIHRQFLIHTSEQDSTFSNIDKLYQLVLRKPNYYLISPNSSKFPKEVFDCIANPYIEVTLMNLIELLLSSTVINRFTVIKQLIVTYGLFAQNMSKIIKYLNYEVTNLEKFNSFLRLASCISILFTNDKAIEVFKKTYEYNSYCISFNTFEQIHKLITKLRNVINEEQATVDKKMAYETLVKFETELLRNWSLENIDNCSEILKIIHKSDQHLWKYSAKTLYIIENNFQLSSTIMANNGRILQNESFDKLKQDLFQLDDSMKKIEVLLTNAIYIQLIFDENYQLLLNDVDKLLPIGTLITKFDHFKKNFDEIGETQNEQKLERISLVFWLRHYLLYYVYALKSNVTNNIIQQIDTVLNNTSPFCSTVKLYIIKQLCHSQNITFHDLCTKYEYRKVDWIQSIIAQPSNRKTLNARYDIILPTPLFEYHNEFKYVEQKLSTNITVNNFKDLISQCSRKQNLAYCFLMWFIHYYTRFYISEIPSDEQFVKLICDTVKEELEVCFEHIGYKLICCLCKNFDKESYFHLDPHMTEEDLHQRLLVLNIIAVIISFKSHNHPSLLTSLLYDENLKVPQNYTEHFDKFSYLPGVALANDQTLIQMINTLTLTENPLESNTNVFRCSLDCFWLFTIENSTVSTQEKQCPLCSKDINISQNETSAIINKRHVQMNYNEILAFITRYMYECKEKDCLKIVEKPDHVSQFVTYHFMNFLTGAVFLFLYDLKYMPNSTSERCTYFKQSIETDCILLRKHLDDADQYYIWMYKIINHMMNEKFFIHGHSDSLKQIIQLEKLVEDELVMPNIDSVIGKIRDYKLAYANLVYENDEKNCMVNFVNELYEDNEQYPFLQFFNVTNIHSIDIIDHFYNKLKLQPNYKNSYPLTAFMLQHLSDYDNIQYLYPIIRFINYLMKEFDHRIKRVDANKKTIADCLNNDSSLKPIYEQFINAWYAITLKEIELQRPQPRHTFKTEIKLSMFLLNKSNDEENMIVAASLQTLANLQNDIIDHFHSHVMTFVDKDEKYHQRAIPVQALREKQLFDMDENQLRKILVEKGMIINYEYGMSQEIIYNYEEIEWILRDQVGCLPAIDMKNIRYFNYQYELCGENVSLINDIRERFEQKLFDNPKRKEIEQYINTLPEDSILRISESLGCVLSYMRTANIKNVAKVNNKYITETLTIQVFVNTYTQLKACMDKKINEEPFSSIELQYIIDLYELSEEYIFDKILHNDIKPELRAHSSSKKNGNITIIDRFMETTLENNNIAVCFKDLNCWIGLFKRLLVRLLLPKIDIDFESPLQVHVKRTDMWKGNISEENIRTIEIEDDIRLKHAFIILERLEENQKEKVLTETAMNSNSVQNNNRNTTATKKKNVLR